MPRDYAAVPHEYWEEMSELSDEEFGRLMRALLRYSETGESIALSGNERFYAKRVMAEEDRHKKSYEAVCAARSAAGHASGEARQRKKQGEQNEQNEQSSTKGSKAHQTRYSETNTETKTKYNSFFSIEKKGSRARAAPEEDKNAWMAEYN